MPPVFLLVAPLGKSCVKGFICILAAAHNFLQDIAPILETKTDPQGFLQSVIELLRMMIV